MSPQDATDGGSLEFFGVQLTVKNAALAALLDSNVADDVQVVGRRAREAFTTEDRSAERDVAARLRQSADEVTIRRDESEEG